MPHMSDKERTYTAKVIARIARQDEGYDEGYLNAHIDRDIAEGYKAGVDPDVLAARLTHASKLPRFLAVRIGDTTRLFDTWERTPLMDALTTDSRPYTPHTTVPTQEAAPKNFPPNLDPILAVVLDPDFDRTQIKSPHD